MKRINCAIFVLFACLLFNSCDTSLNEYVPKNDTEKDITALLNTYLDARNNGDINKLASMFHDKGMYVAGNGATFTKSQIAESGAEWWVQYGKMKLLNSEFKINGNEATVSSTGKLGGVYKAPHITSLIKRDGHWLVVKIKTGN